jgi:hypothetical protein
VPVEGVSVGDAVLKSPVALAYVPGVGLIVREAGHGKQTKLAIFVGGALDA